MPARYADGVSHQVPRDADSMAVWLSQPGQHAQQIEDFGKRRPGATGVTPHG